MKSKLLLGLAFVLSGGLFGCSTAKPDSHAANPLSLSIALLDSPFHDADVNISTNSHFHVVITNNSKKPQNLLMEDSSRQALSFELTDEKGNTYLIRRLNLVGTDGVAYCILKPGEHDVREVCFAEIDFGQNSWWGFPEELAGGGSMKVKMNAVLEVTKDKSFFDAPLWHGRIASPPVTCEIRDSR